MPVMDSRHAAAANRLITWGRLARRCRGTHVASDYRANGASRSHGAGSVANLQEAMPPTRTHLKGAYRWRFFLPFETWKVRTTQSGVETMKQVIASLRSGNWKALLACFLYFDTGFTAWVMFGPLAPYVSKQLSLSPTQAGFLVAVPVLSASIVRVTLGNLFQSVDGKRLALLGISISALPSLILLFPVAPTYSMLLMLGALLGVGGASFAIALPMAGSSYPPRVQGLVLGLAAADIAGGRKSQDQALHSWR